MNDNRFLENVVEEAALAWLESVGWQVAHGPDIAPGEPGRRAPRLRPGRAGAAAARRARAAQPRSARRGAGRRLPQAHAARGRGAVARNRTVHRLLVDGVTVEYRTPDGEIRGAQARVIDFENTAANDWLAVNQFTVAENKHSRRPDIVLFVNGLPLAVLELKNAADENATIWTAFQQLQTYKAEIPSLFATNALLVISDGVEARVGTLTAGREWFKPWRTISGERLADPHLPELQVVIEGVFAPRRFLDLVRDFIVFEDEAAAGSRRRWPATTSSTRCRWR